MQLGDQPHLDGEIWKDFPIHDLWVDYATLFQKGMRIKRKLAENVEFERIEWGLSLIHI